MSYSKIKRIFNLENYLLLFISITAAADTFFYTYLKLHRANFLEPIGLGKISYIYIFIIFGFLAILVYILRNPVSPGDLLKKILLTFLPMELVLLHGYVFKKIGYDVNIFNYTLRPFIGLYLIMACFYFLFKYKKYKKVGDFFRDFGQGTNEKNISKDRPNFFGKIIFWFKNRSWMAIFILLSIVVLNLGFGSYHLAEFAAVDEPLWTHDRIPKFWTNVADGELWKTMISDKPGITAAIISGVGMHWINPTYYKSASWNEASLQEYFGTKALNFDLRFPILLFNALALFAFYFFIKKLLGSAIALISLIFIGLSPLLLGISTIVNPDSLLWTFTPLSLIAYFAYLKDQENKYLYWTGIFLGLAVLTKYVANILYVFFFGLIFLEYIINQAKYEKMGIAGYLKKSFADYLIIIFFSLLAFFLFLPAAWIDINRVAEGTIMSKAFYPIWPAFLGITGLIMADVFIFKNKIVTPVINFLSKYKLIFIVSFNLIFAVLIILTIANTYWGMKFYDLEAILASPKSSKSFGGFLGLMLANFYSLIFGLTPLAFLALFFSNLSNIFNRKKIQESTVWFTYILLFILFYYLASTVEGVSATVRYQIILYPLAMILSAIGIYQITHIERIKKYLIPGFIYSGILILSLYSLNSIRPFYFSYASDLLPDQYVLNLKDMGDGSYEAADYLNKLPDAKNISVWTDKKGVCSFFVGNCTSGFDIRKSDRIDFFVISSGRESRTTKLSKKENPELIRLDKLYLQTNSTYEVRIGGRVNNFVRVISAKDLEQ